MKDKTDQIIEASIKVFVSKGFLQATTQEIAKEANVAEVTLFRKFTSKQNLFEFIIKRVLEDTFQTKVLDLAIRNTTKDFFGEILLDRLTIISKNSQLVRLLISESMMNTIPNHLKLTEVIFNNLKNAITEHFEYNQISLDGDFYAKLIGSILLGSVILPVNVPFHQLTQSEQDTLIEHYTHALITNIPSNK